MQVQLRSLDHVIEYVGALQKEQFALQYPGYFLIAMGLLSAEQIAAGNPAAAIARNRHPLRTVPLVIGRQPRHQTGQAHPLAGKMFHFPDPGEKQLLLGRGEQCQICVPDGSVSEEHLQLQVLAAGLAVVDLGSTNGTSINLKPLPAEQMQLLCDGDMLTVGRYSFQLLGAATLHSTLSLIRALDEGD